MTMLAAGAMLAAATLVSEDAATLTAGALVAANAIGAEWAIASVAFGIWAGDLGLFAVGRLARRTPAVARWVDRRWSLEQVRLMETRFSRGAPVAILGSRFMPGTRVLLYVAAGLLHVRVTTFAATAAIASVVWTMMIVSAVGSLGALW
jgi:membrane protein DedA with SNARE-associated domain